MKTHLEKVDFLRGIAILLVFVYHASLVIFIDFNNVFTYSCFFLNYKIIPKIDLLLLFMPSSYGGSGVSLFLIISGFLIHYGTIKKGLRFSTLLFFNKRFWRIYPPYLLAVLLFYFFAKDKNAIDLFSHLFLIHNLSNTTFSGINPSFWSLALEAQLYILYPIYLILYRKFGNNLSFLLIAGLTIISIIIQLLFKIDSRSYDSSILKYWILWVGGAYLAHVYNSKKRISNVTGTQLTLFFTGVVLLRFTILYALVNLYLFGLFYILLMDWFLHKNINISNILYRFIISVGLCSYSIYLFHQPYLYELINLVRFGFYSFLITAPLCFLFLYLVARLTYKYVELPSIALGSKAYAYQNNKIKKYFLSILT